MARQQIVSRVAASLVLGLVAAPIHGFHAQATAARVKADSAFLQEAASGGLMEVQLGRLAQQKAASPAVKQFGQRMVTDHSKANQQLMAVARQGGLTLSSGLAPKQQREVDQLSGKSGKEFDSAYMMAMVKDHTEDIQKFQQEKRSASSEPVRRLTSHTLPMLQQHLSLATQVARQVGADTTSPGQSPTRRSR